MIPFLQFHALAATRGEGLRPEFLDLFKRQAEQAFINPLGLNDDACHDSKANLLSPEELARRVRTLADGFSTDPVAQGDDGQR
jgi:hypothetical protein